MEMYGSSRVEVLGKFYAFLRWKGKIYRQPFYVTTANSSPNLLSRDACYTLGVVRPCYAVEAEWSNLQAGSASKSTRLTCGRSACKSTRPMCDGSYNVIYKHNRPEIHSIEASNNTQLSDEKLKQRLPDEEHRQRSSRHSTQSTEIVNSRKASTNLNTLDPVQIYTQIYRMCQIYNYKICKIYRVSRIYNTICNQIYTDSDSQGEETASASSGLYLSY